MDDFLYFLLIIDVFSRHIYVKPLKKKDGSLVGKALEEIFSIIEEKNTRIQHFQTDQGTEFTSNRPLFKKHNIYFSTKHLKNKSSFAEQAIYLVLINVITIFLSTCLLN